MGLQNFKPTSPARRLMQGPDFAEVTKAKPERKLTEPLRKSGGRNLHGHIVNKKISVSCGRKFSCLVLWLYIPKPTK